MVTLANSIRGTRTALVSISHNSCDNSHMIGRITPHEALRQRSSRRDDPQPFDLNAHAKSARAAVERAQEVVRRAEIREARVRTTGSKSGDAHFAVARAYVDAAEAWSAASDVIDHTGLVGVSKGALSGEEVPDSCVVDWIYGQRNSHIRLARDAAIHNLSRAIRWVEQAELYYLNARTSEAGVAATHAARVQGLLHKQLEQIRRQA